MPRTWIIIVNYRTSELVIDTLTSLSDQVNSLGGGSVVIVDNASGDGSVDRLKAHIDKEGWSNWAKVIAKDINGGFAFGNNSGIGLALSDAADYIMLLNPDTIVRPNALEVLVDFMEANPQTGIAGSLLENPQGGIDCSAHKVHSPLSELDNGARLGVLSGMLKKYVVSEKPKEKAHECDWVSGASMIIRRSVFENTGLMDERFFLYFEEVDFCWRAKKEGWKVCYVPQSRILHLEGAATGIKTKAKRRAGYWYESRRRFFIKHYGILGLLVADSLWFIGRISLLIRSKAGLGGKNIDADPKWFMLDLCGGDIKAILTGNALKIRRTHK